MGLGGDEVGGANRVPVAGLDGAVVGGASWVPVAGLRAPPCAPLKLRNGSMSESLAPEEQVEEHEKVTGGALSSRGREGRGGRGEAARAMYLEHVRKQHVNVKKNHEHEYIVF